MVHQRTQWAIFIHFQVRKLSQIPSGSHQVPVPGPDPALLPSGPWGPCGLLRADGLLEQRGQGSEGLQGHERRVAGGAGPGMMGIWVFPHVSTVMGLPKNGGFIGNCQTKMDDDLGFF